MNRYRILNKLGEGTYGNVYKAIDQQTDKIVAIKQVSIVNKEEGVPGTTLREISIMLELENPHIARIFSIFNEGDKLSIVMEYCDLDLRKFLDQNKPLSADLIRILLLQIARATHFCHCHRVMHRDLKPQNVLIKFQEGLPVCKLCDFGLARSFNVPVRAFTHEIVTLWYRAPEILLSQKSYSTAVDVWSIGCIWAEMLLGRPLFRARSEVEMLFEIFELLGTPTEETWGGVTGLPDFSGKFPRFKGRGLRSQIGEGVLGAAGFELLCQMLEMDPARRVGLREVLDSAYFA